jgi:hypothetical protein
MRQHVARFARILSALACGVVSLTASPGIGRAQSGDEQVVVPVPQDDEYADTDPSALTDFRPTLDPHGAWVDDPNYGTAWTPSQDEVGPDFAPYESDGQWDYVDGDYSWVSDFVWGWVCFHYGRWVYSGGLWLWIPGRTYAPAWVDWRLTNDDPTYLGWAPAAPAWGWSGGSAVRLVLNTYEPWTYVGASDVFGPGLSTRVVTGGAAQRLTAQSHPYVRTRPQAPGRMTLQPVMHGPPPALLGIDVTRIAHPANGSREQRARQLARPSTALPLGAHAPTPHVLRASPIRQSWGSGAPSRGGGVRGRR